MKTVYNEVILNISEILLVQPFNFEISSFCDDYSNWIEGYIYKRRKITSSQVKELEELFIKEECKTLKITNIHKL